MGISLLGAKHIRKGQAVRIWRPRKYLASPVAFAGTKFRVLRPENHSLIQIQTYSSFLLCPSSVLFIFTLHLCVCLPALLTCSGALRTRPSAGRGTRLVRTGTALASAAIARPDQRRRLRWRLHRHLSPSGRWIF